MSGQRVAVALLLAALSAAEAAFAQGSCAATPTLRVGVFQANGTPGSANVSERMTALSQQLATFVQQRSPDVLCVNDLRNAELRTTALAGLVSQNTWNIFHPAAVSQAGCQNACSNQAPNQNTPIINQWVQACSLTIIPELGNSCAGFSGLAYQQCLTRVCPDLQNLLPSSYPNCANCLGQPQAGESTTNMVQRCATSYVPADAAKCRLGYGGEAGGTLISRYPFTATEYREFTPPAPSTQVGLANWGITYGQVQTPVGKVHLFCAAPATGASGLASGVAEPLNLAQSQEVLSYMQLKANGEAAILLGDTGSGPAVASSPTGAAAAQWAPNFTTLQTGLTDALLANVDANSAAASAAACTYKCNGGTAGEKGYVDHVMGSGKGAVEGLTPDLCYRNGSTFFTTATAPVTNGTVPLSDHFGVITDVSLGNGTTTVASNASAPFRAANQVVNLTALVTSAAGTVNQGTVTFTVPGVGTAVGTVTNGLATGALTIPGGTSVGSRTITASYAASFLASSSDATRTLTIGKANPVLTWPAPAPMVFGSALGSAQLNATANVAGTFAYFPPAGTVLPMGANQALGVVFTPADPVNYNGATLGNSITVTAGSATGANLIVQRTLSRDGSNNVVVTLVLANNGGATANNVTVTSVRLGAVNGAPVPRVLGNIASGGQATAVFTIPGTAGLAVGSANTVSVAGTYTGSTFSSGSRVTLP